MKWGARLLWLAIVLGALEVLAGAWIEHYGDTPDHTRRIVEADETFGWRQRPDLDTSFYGQPLRTNELGWRAPALSSVSGQTAVLLGPSSAFGWGVKAEETYAGRLPGLLRGWGLTVVNASEIGYSTEQGLLLLARPEIAALKPKLLLVAYGVKDLDRHRFYFQSDDPDSVELRRPHSRATLAVFRALSRSSLLSVLYKMANAVRDFVPRAAAPGFTAPSVRVPPGDFVRNLRAFAAEGRRLGARVFFLGTPVNLPPYRPFAADAEARLVARFQQGVKFFETGELEGARLVFEELMRLEPRRNEVYYYLREIAHRRGRRTEERAYDEMIRLSEPLRIHRDVLAYNALMKQTAAEEKVGFVDLDAEFPESDKSPFFVDPIHPSAAGHERIARAVARAIEGR